jgi:hypothetical protein
MSRVYIASSWKNAEAVRELAEDLRSRGHEVFDFTTPHQRPEGFDLFVFDASAWVKHDGGSPSEIDWLEFLSWPPSQRAFASDKAGLDWADTVIMLLPCGRSSHLEAGYAAGTGKRLFIHGDLPRGEFDVMYGFAEHCSRSTERAEMLDLLVKPRRTGRR